MEKVGIEPKKFHYFSLNVSDKTLKVKTAGSIFCAVKNGAALIKSREKIKKNVGKVHPSEKTG